ncbi:MAG: hypothetical protein D8M59_08010 [Planctomycetes bacterium]|nr:hypothetical protein [Planctomycetota bacterium]NOG53267.1 hypothetical protein [Planctomycetota bacterium]
MEKTTQDGSVTAFRRAVIAAALILGFMFTASVISPQRGKADPEGTPVASPHALLQDGTFGFDIVNDDDSPAVTADRASVLGELVSHEYRIQIHAGYPEPTYTIMRLDGSLLAHTISREEALLRFPGLPAAVFAFGPHDEAGEVTVEEAGHAGVIGSDSMDGPADPMDR